MITKDLKISKMLRAYPETLDVLIEISPHFKKLKNPVLRKALAGRVSVEQAAGVAGVDVNLLLEKLNASIGVTQPGVSLTENKKGDKMTKNNIEEKPLENINPEKVITFDVRPIINEGKDPLKFILAKVKELTEDEILLLINSFEPIPLYSVLGRMGYSHQTQKEGEVFKIYFYREEKTAAAEEDNQQRAADEIDVTAFENIVELDVRGLEPPEPMVKILETLSKIDDKTALLVDHHREPVMLYPKLEERGYRAFCTKVNDNYFKIVIARK